MQYADEDKDYAVFENEGEDDDEEYRIAVFRGTRLFLLEIAGYCND